MNEGYRFEYFCDDLEIQEFCDFEENSKIEPEPEQGIGIPHHDIKNGFLKEKESMNEINILKPKKPITHTLRIETEEIEIINNKNLICHYCGKILGDNKNDKIYKHLEEEFKKNQKLLIPLFRFDNNKEKLFFMKDSCKIGLPKEVCIKIRNRFKIQRLNEKLDLHPISSKDHYFRQLPLTLRHSRTVKTHIIELDLTIQNILDEILFKYKFSFIKTNLILKT
jgi:hypothetical protein